MRSGRTPPCGGRKGCLMRRQGLVLALTLALALGASQAPGQFIAHDPGVRGGPAGAGGMLAGLSPGQQAVFDAGLDDFSEQEGVGGGLGPRFNLDSCAGCHTQPATGGTSPAVNPQVGVATAFGARTTVPSFIRPHGPVREARFKFKPDGSRDGGVHALFVISGRVDATGDASGCAIKQDDFEGNLGRNNVIFRIPTPTFGAGLVEMIPDSAIVANKKTAATVKSSLGIGGRPHFILPTGDPNRNGNDGTIARFGWKAQNTSLLLFSGEAYNVEMGITNELFQTGRDETPTCQFTTVPNTVTNTTGATAQETISAIEKFAFFMRFLAPPAPSADTPGGAASIARGKTLFGQIGCALCHTPTLQTGNSTVAALRDQNVNLFSDMLVHDMGIGLADGVRQGEAGPREFRSAPLWGLGKRVFFLHDGRTSDLIEAIEAHKSGNIFSGTASEENVVISLYNTLLESQT